MIRRCMRVATVPLLCSLSVPAAAPDPVSSTVVLKIKGPLDIAQAGLAQDYDGSVVLPASTS